MCTKTNIRSGIRLTLVFIICLIVILFSAICRYRSGEIDYHNSDATWHTLLTVEAYNQTPISQHLFLPIVSLGKADDKGIPWGATIPDTEGNYYYTSFSPMGYFLPWLFMKIFKLSICEKSLYVFNTVLFAISECLLIWLLSIVYQENKYRLFLCLSGGILYATMPELLHGMGIVYWHQSVLQVTLLLQIIAFYKYAVLNEKHYCGLFYFLAFFNPYTEWTGYVANIGFALAVFIIKGKSRKKKFIDASALVLITIFAFVAFSVHYMMRTDCVAYFMALKNRFMARNVTTQVSISSVVKGYIDSFLYAWVLLALLTIWNFIKNKKIELRKGILFLVISFPALENIIMKQHAVEYTYDRMKVSWIVIFLVCELICNLLDSSHKKYTEYIILAIVCFTSLINFQSYKKNNSYIWNVDYREKNQQLANYIVDRYPDALYVSNSAIRGYMNLLFGRGIWEWQDLNNARKLATQKDKKNIVYLQPSGYDLQTINVYSCNGDEIIDQVGYTVNNGNIVEIELGDYLIDEKDNN